MGASGAGAYEIEKSLRFNQADDTYLERTPSSAGSTTTGTISLWCKRTSVSIEGSDDGQALCGTGGGGSGASGSWLEFRDTGCGQLQLSISMSGSNNGKLKTNHLFRDFSEWMHIVAVIDTSNGTSGDRLRLFVNGVRQTDFATETYPSQNQTVYLNTNDKFGIGAFRVWSNQSTKYNYFDGYIADFHLIDGTALNADSFGETDTITGKWIPKKYAGSHGTNGFFLEFKDNSGTTASTLGKDSSGNSNNFTPSNFSVTAGKTNDSLTDTPTNNYCTLNPLNTGQAIDPSDGNLKLDWNTHGNLHEIACGTFGFKSGSWYWEMQLDSGHMSDSVGVGIVRDDQNINESGDGPVANPTSYEAYGYRNDGKKLTKAGGAENYGDTWTSTSDVIGVHVDFTGGTGSITFYKNNSSQGAISSIPLNNHWLPFIGGYGDTSGNQSKMYINFGQRDFAYTPPTGAKALCNSNLPEPTIADGTKHFNTVLYTGNGGSQSVTGVGFQPDLLWIKNRDQADNHQLHDVVRGTSKRLETNTSGAEYNDADALDSFDSDGFSMDNNYDSHNKSSEKYVAWNWKGGGSGSSNTTGDINSTVSANTSAGFSIVSYQGNGTAGQTIGHGMGVAPEIIIFKNRSSNSRNWEINAVNPNDQTFDYFYLNLTAAVGGGSLGINTPTSSVFEVTAGNDANQNGHDIMAYCFSSVEGYSKFGTYVGNGNADGPFIYTGFKPAFVMLKTLTFDKGWRMTDSARDPTNPIHKSLFPNLSEAEYTATGSHQQGQDFLSNGFKIRNTNSRDNQDGDRYMYLAFASKPFKYSNAI